MSQGTGPALSILKQKGQVMDSQLSEGELNLGPGHSSCLPPVWSHQRKSSEIPNNRGDIKYFIQIMKYSGFRSDFRAKSFVKEEGVVRPWHSCGCPWIPGGAQGQVGHWVWSSLGQWKVSLPWQGVTRLSPKSLPMQTILQDPDDKSGKGVTRAPRPSPGEAAAWRAPWGHSPAAF